MPPIRKATFDELCQAETEGKFFLKGCYIYSYENSMGQTFDIGMSQLSAEDKALLFNDIFTSDWHKSKKFIGNQDGDNQ